MQSAHFIISTGDAIAYSEVVSDRRDKTRIADLMPILWRLRRAEQLSLIA
jgi:hypothetical protein